MNLDALYQYKQFTFMAIHSFLKATTTLLYFVMPINSDYEKPGYNRMALCSQYSSAWLDNGRGKLAK